MRYLPLLAATLFLPACIIVPPQNACVFPSPVPSVGTVGTGTTGSPVPGASPSAGATTGTGTGTGTTTPSASPSTTGTTTTTSTGLNLTALGPPATQLQAGAGATFLSNNTSIATVDATGQVTGVANGQTTIAVTVGGVTTQVPVTVQQQATTLRVTTALPGVPLVAGVPIQVSATATDANGQPIAGVTFRFDPDPGTAANAITVDATGKVTLPAPSLTKVSGTIRAVTPAGQVSADADSLKVSS